jgi:hypothetical protein
VHRALSALLLTGAAIYTANTLLLGGKRKVMPNIRPLNRGANGLSSGLATIWIIAQRYSAICNERPYR